MTQGSDVYVTGGTGYVGQGLIPALLALGHNIRVLGDKKGDVQLLQCGQLHERLAPNVPDVFKYEPSPGRGGGIE